MVSHADIVGAVSRLKKRLAGEIPIDRVLLFGSQGRGDARPDSDVDLIIVSPAFRGRSLGQRGYPIRKAWDLDVAVDFLCYTPEEFEARRNRATIVQLALDEGREIVA